MTLQEAKNSRVACEREVKKLEQSVIAYRSRMVGAGNAFGALKQRLKAAQQRLQSAVEAENKLTAEILRPARHVSLRHENGEPKKWVVAGSKKKRVQFWEDRLTRAVESHGNAGGSLSIETTFSFNQLYGENNAKTLRELEHALASGTCSSQTVHIPQIQFEPSAIIPLEKDAAHGRLCMRSYFWLRYQGIKASFQDSVLRYAGGIADLAAPSFNLYVECGCTKVEKVAAALQANQRVLVFPYGTDKAVLFAPGRDRYALKLSPAVLRVTVNECSEFLAKRAKLAKGA